MIISSIAERCSKRCRTNRLWPNLRRQLAAGALLLNWRWFLAFLQLAQLIRQAKVKWAFAAEAVEERFGFRYCVGAAFHSPENIAPCPQNFTFVHSRPL